MEEALRFLGVDLISRPFDGPADCCCTVPILEDEGPGTGAEDAFTLSFDFDSVLRERWVFALFCLEFQLAGSRLNSLFKDAILAVAAFAAFRWTYGTSNNCCWL